MEIAGVSEKATEKERERERKKEKRMTKKWNIIVSGEKSGLQKERVSARVYEKMIE